MFSVVVAGAFAALLFARGSDPGASVKSNDRRMCCFGCDLLSAPIVMRVRRAGVAQDCMVGGSKTDTGDGLLTHPGQWHHPANASGGGVAIRGEQRRALPRGKAEVLAPESCPSRVPHTQIRAVAVALFLTRGIH